MHAGNIRLESADYVIAEFVKYWLTPILNRQKKRVFHIVYVGSSTRSILYSMKDTFSGRMKSEQNWTESSKGEFRGFSAKQDFRAHHRERDCASAGEAFTRWTLFFERTLHLITRNVSRGVTRHSFSPEKNSYTLTRIHRLCKAVRSIPLIEFLWVNNARNKLDGEG